MQQLYPIGDRKSPTARKPPNNVLPAHKRFFVRLRLGPGIVQSLISQSGSHNQPAGPNVFKYAHH